MKKNIIYISIIILLSAIVFFLLKKPVKTTESFDNNMFKADSSKIIEISFEKNGGKITLSKGLNKWRISEPGNFEADTNIKNMLLKFVNDITLKNIISEKPEKFSKFGVDSTAIILTVRNEDNGKIRYIIGNDDQERNYSFFRKEGENRIYLGTLFPRYRITANVSDWRDKFISKTSQNELSKVTLTSGSDVLELNKSEADWKFSLNGKEVTDLKDKTDKLLSRLSGFRCADFIDGKSLSDIDSPITVIYNTGGAESQFVVGKTGEEYTAYRNDKNQMYQIQENDFKIFEELFKKNL